MTKKLKKTSLIVLALALVLAVVLTVVTYGKVQTVDAAFLLTTENVTVETDKSISHASFGDKKGYAFTSSKNGEKISLKEGVAGIFSIEFTPYSSVAGENDFTEFTFTFTSPESRVSFDLSFVPKDAGVMMNVKLSNSLGRFVSVNMDGSFCNLSDKTVKFTFDPNKMVVKNAQGVSVADFKSADFLATYYVPEALNSFKTYSVDMRFGGIKEGRTAKVLIFDVCGQKLNGQTLTNTSAPVIYSTPTLDSGVVGVSYRVSKNVETFDMIDGFKDTFYGDVKVYDQTNKEITLTDGAFVPEYAGNYIAVYTPIDQNGLKGKSLSVRFYVYASQPEVEFIYSTPVDDIEVGVGTKLTFPEIVANSKLTENKLNVFANVIKDSENKMSAVDCSNGFGYVFDELGEYTVEFYAQDRSEYVAKQSVKVTVSNVAVFTGVDFGGVYEKDVVINLSNATCTLNGQTTGEVTTLTTYPSGKTTSSSNVICDEEGVYAVEYFCGSLSTVRYFTVKNDNFSLWEKTSGLTIETDATAPDYADFAYNGVMFTTNRPVEAVYKNTLDIADNTKDDLLCELFVAPSTAGTMELTCVDVIITDVHDSSNLINIRLTEDAWRRTEMQSKMSIMALPFRDFNTAKLQEINPTSTTNEVILKYYYNASVYASFYGKYGDSATSYPSNSIKLYFDYEEGKVYADYAGVKGQANGKVCVADLNNESYVGSGNAYKGFTTGEAKISIKLSGIRQTAHVMVLNIDGQSMTGKSTVDTTAPSIILDYAGNQANSLPKAVVGKQYKIFDPTTVDLIDGYGKNVQITVYKKQGAVWGEYERNDMTFVPDQAGSYMIRYQAVDSSNNKSVKEVKITAVDSVRELSYEFNDNISNLYSVGQTFNYYAGSISGGTGVIEKNVKVFLNGDEIALDENNSFLIDKAGEYSLQVVLKDYVSVSNPFIKTFTVQYSSKPIIADVAMPDALVEGEEFAFPEVDAKVYTETDVQTIPVVWYAKYGEDGEFALVEGNFIPTQSGIVYLKAKANESETVYKVNVTKKISNQDYNHLSQYVYSNASVVPFANKDLFNPTATSAIHYEFTSDSVWSVARAIDVNFASIVFGISSCKFNSIDFTLRDSYDPNISVTITITSKNADECFVNVNGKTYTVNASFIKASAYGEFKISFNSIENTILINSISVAQVEKTDAGKIFNGFTSGKVYMQLSIKSDKSGETSKIGISQVAGQPYLPTIKKDTLGPTIAVDGVIEDVNYGEYIRILDAKAFDFISSVKSLKVSVTSPSGKALYSNVNVDAVAPILADEIGIYKITYTAIDANDNQGTYEIGVKIIDYVAPQITLSGSVPTEGRVGQKIVLPKMTATDDNTATEDIVAYVYYVAPNAMTVEIKNNQFTPDQKGLYMVIYFAQDSDGATSVQYYQVRVK